jgi:hypothetical protein
VPDILISQTAMKPLSRETTPAHIPRPFPDCLPGFPALLIVKLRQSQHILLNPLNPYNFSVAQVGLKVNESTHILAMGGMPTAAANPKYSLSASSGDVPA